jgi:large repetitive protein
MPAARKGRRFALLTALAIAAGSALSAGVPLGVADAATAPTLGVTNTGGIVYTATPFFRVLATTPGATVTVQEGATDLCTIAADGGGNGSCTSIALPEGPHTVTAVATDANGSATSAPLSFTIDSTPNAPVVTTPAEGATVPNPVVFSGTADVHNTVFVLSGSATICDAPVDASGSWSCAPIEVDPQNPSVTVFARDPGSNQSTHVIRNFVIAAPLAAPVITTPTDGADTNVRAISGTAADGTSVTVSEGATALCSAPIAAGAWSCTPNPQLAQGSHTITATATDGTTTSPVSAPVTFTLDTELVDNPQSCVQTSPSTATCSGTSEPFATVTSNPLGVCAATANASGAWSCDVSDLNTAFSFRETDRAGNSQLSGAPARPVITAPTDEALLGASPAIISGVLEFGTPFNASVKVLDESGDVVCAVSGIDTSTWACSPTAQFADGAHRLTAVFEQASSYTALPITITVDTTAAAPTATCSADGHDLTCSGKGEVGATVTVTNPDPSTVCTAVVDAAGAWSCSGITLDEPTDVLVHQVDRAGNVSPTITVPVERETTGPGGPGDGGNPGGPGDSGNPGGPGTPGNGANPGGGTVLPADQTSASNGAGSSAGDLAYTGSDDIRPVLLLAFAALLAGFALRILVKRGSVKRGGTMRTGSEQR